MKALTIYKKYITLLTSIKSYDDIVFTDNEVGEYEDENFTCAWKLNGVNFVYWISPECPEYLSGVTDGDVQKLLELSLEKFDEIGECGTCYDYYDNNETLSTIQISQIKAEVDRIKTLTPSIIKLTVNIPLSDFKFRWYQEDRIYLHFNTHGINLEYVYEDIISKINETFVGFTVTDLAGKFTVNECFSLAKLKTFGLPVSDES